MNFVPPEIPVPKRNNISPSSLKFSKSFFSTFKDNFFIWPIWPIIIEINNTPPVVVRLKQEPSSAQAPPSLPLPLPTARTTSTLLTLPHTR